MTDNYKRKLNESLDHLHEQLNACFEVYMKADRKLLLTQPVRGKWSIIQILNHLLTSEKLSVNYLEYKLNLNTTIPSLSIRNRINSVILILAFYSPFKFRAPEKNGINNPQNSGDIQAIANEFDKNRKALRIIINKIPHDDIKRAWFKHPYVGRMGLKVMLRFFGAHFIRHHKQALKILAKA